jgi:hypothetical protein
LRLGLQGAGLAALTVPLWAPVEGGAAAVSEAAGRLAGCAGMVGVHSQGLLQGPGAQWNPRLKVG